MPQSRPDGVVTQKRLDELSSVRRFITPVFEHEDPVTGRKHRLITQSDAEMIAQGYACGECGAVYDMVMPKCVVCFQPIGLDLAPMRPEWEQHLRDRREAFSHPTPVNPLANGVDDVIRRVRENPDVEQVKL